MSDNELKIPKERVQVRMRVRGGVEWGADLFLDACSQFHTGPQGLVEYLNQPAQFFPARMESGEVRLIAKREIVFVALSADVAERFGGMDPAVSASARFELADGVSLDGEVDLGEAEVGVPRAIDALNGGKTFLCVRKGRSLWAVSKAAIRWTVPSDARTFGVGSPREMAHV
jgi:hypothetical protein